MKMPNIKVHDRPVIESSVVIGSSVSHVIIDYGL